MMQSSWAGVSALSKVSSVFQVNVVLATTSCASGGTPDDAVGATLGKTTGSAENDTPTRGDVAPVAGSGIDSSARSPIFPCYMSRSCSCRCSVSAALVSSGSSACLSIRWAMVAGVCQSCSNALFCLGVGALNDTPSKHSRVLLLVYRERSFAVELQAEIYYFEDGTHP